VSFIIIIIFLLFKKTSIKKYLRVEEKLLLLLLCVLLALFHVLYCILPFHFFHLFTDHCLCLVFFVDQELLTHAHIMYVCANVCTPASLVCRYFAEACPVTEGYQCMASILTQVFCL